MSRRQIKTSLALWLARERYRRARWRTARALRNQRGREKWWRLYELAREIRLRRQKQLNKPAHHVSLEGVELIEKFEGFVGHPYKDAVGVWTIGYGHTEGVGPNTKRISQQKATELLRKDLDKKYAPTIRALKLPLNQNQFDALTSFVYNEGSGAVGKTTHVGRALRSHQWRDAADALLEWNKIIMSDGRVIVLDGLRRRRIAERDLFLKKAA